MPELKIKPVQYSHFCDYAAMGMGGKLNLSGIFDHIFLKTLPGSFPIIYVVTKLLLPKGEHKVTFTLMQEDRVLAKASIEKDVKETLIAHTHLWGVQDLKITSFLPIEFQVLIDGKQVFIMRLPVLEMKEAAK